jgi:hypothetical protein
MGTKTGLDRLVINELALRFLAAFIVKRIGNVLCVDQVLNRNAKDISRIWRSALVQ